MREVNSYAEIGFFKVYFYLLLLVYMCWIVCMYVCVSLCTSRHVHDIAHVRRSKGQLCGALSFYLYLSAGAQIYVRVRLAQQESTEPSHWFGRCFTFSDPSGFDINQMENVSNAGSSERVLGAREKPILNRLQLCGNEDCEEREMKGICPRSISS